jgi:hypothetical protein
VQHFLLLQFLDLFPQCCFQLAAPLSVVPDSLGQRLPFCFLLFKLSPKLLILFVQAFYFMLEVGAPMRVSDEFVLVFAVFEPFMEGSADCCFQILPEFADFVVFGEGDALFLFLQFGLKEDGLSGRRSTD